MINIVETTILNNEFNGKDMEKKHDINIDESFSVFISTRNMMRYGTW